MMQKNLVRTSCERTRRPRLSLPRSSRWHTRCKNETLQGQPCRILTGPQSINISMAFSPASSRRQWPESSTETSTAQVLETYDVRIRPNHFSCASQIAALVTCLLRINSQSNKWNYQRPHLPLGSCHRSSESCDSRGSPGRAYLRVD